MDEESAPEELVSTPPFLDSFAPQFHEAASPNQVEASTPGTFLALGADALLVRACLLEPVSGRYRLVHWADAPRQGERTLERQVAQLCRRMGSQMGRTIWDAQQNTPYWHGADPVREPPITATFATLGLRAPLRLWLAGLSRERSLAVAQQAVQRSPVTLCGTTCLEPQIDVSALNQALLAAQPQVLVLCGGYEGATLEAQEAVCRLSALLGSVLRHLPLAQQPLCIYAGNSDAADEAKRILQVTAGSIRFVAVDNVHPAPGQRVEMPLWQALHEQILQLHGRMLEHSQLSRWLLQTNSVAPAHVAFTQAVQAWRLHRRLPELHGAYQDGTGWLHVWASAQEAGVQTFFSTHHNAADANLAGWPPLHLVSGLGPLQEHDSVRWRDPLGLLPVVTPVGQVEPLAMLDVFAADLLYES